MFGALTLPITLLLGSILAVLAPLLPMELLVGMHTLIGSGKWASLPPGGMGLPLATALAVLFAYAARRPGQPTWTRPRDSSVTFFVGAVLFFIVWAALSLTWGLSTGYGLDKFLRLSLLNVAPAWAVCVAVARGVLRTTQVLLVLRFAALAVGVLGFSSSLLMVADADNSRLAVGNSDPITFGVIASLGVVLWLLHFDETRNPLRRVGAMLAVLVCGVALVGSNSKGPVIATAIVLVAMAVRYPSRRAWGRILAIAGLGVLIFTLAPASYTSRFDPQVYEQADQDTSSESVSGRLRLYTGAITQFVESPVVGSGIGGFNQVPRVTRGMPEAVGGSNQAYPHNLVLEVGSELGIVGLLALAAVGGGAARLVLSRRTEPAPFAIAVLLCTGTVFSGDMSDHRLFWLAMALIIGTRLSTPSSATEPGHVTRQATVR